MRIRILLADDCADTRRAMRSLIELESNFEVVGEAENGAVAVEKTLKLQPDVVIMDINMPVLNGIDATAQITLQAPMTAVLICSVQGERDYLRQAMTAGAKDFLVKPVSADGLFEAVQNVCAMEKRRHLRVKSEVLEEQMLPKSTIFSLISAKGGVGKSTIAVNLAATAARLGKSVCVVDLDLQFGDVALLLSQPNARRNIYQLVQEAAKIDGELLDKYLLRHESGVRLLAAPMRPEEGEYVTSDHVLEILATLREQFQLVIVDTAPVTNDLFFSLLEHSDLVGLVNTPSLGILKNNHNLLQLLDKLGIEREKVRALLNRSQSKTGVRERDVEEVLGLELFFDLPNDFEFVDSAANAGVPWAWKHPTHRLSKQLESLCYHVLGEEKRRGLLRQKRGWKWFG